MNLARINIVCTADLATDLVNKLKHLPEDLLEDLNLRFNARCNNQVYEIEVKSREREMQVNVPDGARNIQVYPFGRIVEFRLGEDKYAVCFPGDETED